MVFSICLLLYVIGCFYPFIHITIFGYPFGDYFLNAILFILPFSCYFSLAIFPMLFFSYHPFRAILSLAIFLMLFSSYHPFCAILSSAIFHGFWRSKRERRNEFPSFCSCLVIRVLCIL